MGLRHQGSLSSSFHSTDGVTEALRREMTCSKSHYVREWARTLGDPWLGVTAVDPLALCHDRIVNRIQYLLPALHNLPHPKDPHKLEEEFIKALFLFLQGLHHSFGDSWGQDLTDGRSFSRVTLRLHYLAQLPGTACLHHQRSRKVACGGLGGSSSRVKCQPRYTHCGWA